MNRIASVSSRAGGRGRTVVVLSTICGALVAAVAAGGAIALCIAGRDDPGKYATRVAELEGRYASGFPKGEVLLTGSSFFEYWSTSESDLAPLHTVNIGIGGTKVGDHLAYFDRMVVPFEPRVLVLYVGSNDISGIPFYSKSAQATVQLVAQYIARAKDALPATRIYYVAITETPSRASVRADIQAANRMLAQLADTTGDFVFIDTAPALLLSSGEIDQSLFGEDRLHFNEKGYRVFADAVRSGLQAEY